jgi:PDZ domain-containing protein
LTDLPFDVEIDTAQVGGPSAGLALTLSIIDKLTEGELTGGLRVATTGTIDIDGTVGPIGGIQQKAHAVRRAGIDVFIVPEDDAETAREVLGDSAEVIGVRTLDEAIDALGRLGGQTEALALPPESAPA